MRLLRVLRRPRDEMRDRAQDDAPLSASARTLRPRIDLKIRAGLRTLPHRVEKHGQIPFHPGIESFNDRISGIVARGMLKFEDAGRYCGRMANLNGGNRSNASLFEGLK